MNHQGIDSEITKIIMEKMYPKELKQVFTCLDSLPVSTADCERGFGTMKRIMTPMRNSYVSHLYSLTFININGPPLEMWNPKDYIKQWFKHQRHADDRLQDPGYLLNIDTAFMGGSPGDVSEDPVT